MKKTKNSCTRFHIVYDDVRREMKIVQIKILFPLSEKINFRGLSYRLVF